MRIKKLSLSGIERTKLFLGYVGENEHTQIRFDASCIYTDNPGARAGLTMQNPAGTVFPIVLDADGNEIIWNVSASDVAIAGNGSYQLTFTDNDEIIKTFIGQLFVLKSLTSAGDIPTPIENWIDQANQKLSEVEAATESIDNMDASATKLAPDASPTVTVSDVDGHKHLAFGIPQGEKGDKGEKGDTYEVTPENIEEISSRVVQSATIAQYTEGMADQVEAAQQHAKDAGDSATAADSSKKSAAQSAQAASQSATAADTSARNAAQSESNAGNSASAASQSAQAASQSASNAAQSERNAADSAQDAHDVLDSIPEDYSTLSNDVTVLKSATAYGLNVSTTNNNKHNNLLQNYFYKANTIKSTTGDETTVSGYDLYKVPMSNIKILKITGDTTNPFWGSLSDNFAVGIELSDNTYVPVKTNPRVDNAIFLSTSVVFVAFGNTNVAYAFFVVAQGKESTLEITIDYPVDAKDELLNINQIPHKITDNNAIGARLNITNNTVDPLSNPYYTLNLPIKQNDKITFNGRIDSLTYNAIFATQGWAKTAVNYSTLNFVAPSDGFISVFAKIGSDPNATIYPAESFLNNYPTKNDIQDDLLPYALSENSVLKVGNGKINTDNIITDPHITNISNWRISDNNGGGTWTIEDGDQLSNILKVNTGTNDVLIVPYLDTTRELQSCVVAFRFKGEEGKAFNFQMVMSAKTVSDNETVVPFNTRFDIWDRTEIGWKEVVIPIDVSEPIKNISVAIYFPTHNYSCEISHIYIGEKTWAFPFSLDNGLYYDGIGDSVIKTLPAYGKNIVCFGDSITDNGFRFGSDIATKIKFTTGANVVNFGFGGCQMSQHHTNYYDPFSMYRLAYAIANNDWTEQDNVLELSPIPANAKTKINSMKSYDFSKVDAITIEYGTNDWANGQPIENANNKTDTDTICGALRYSLNTLLTAFPHLKVFIVSLAWRCRTSNGVITTDSDTDTNSQGNTVGEINTALKGVADEYHVQFIDMYNTTSFNRLTFYANFIDGIHPGYRGRQTMGGIISKYLI